MEILNSSKGRTINSHENDGRSLTWRCLSSFSLIIFPTALRYLVVRPPRHRCPRYHPVETLLVIFISGVFFFTIASVKNNKFNSEICVGSKL